MISLKLVILGYSEAKQGHLRLNEVTETKGKHTSLMTMERKAAGVVQTTKRTTMAMRTTTSIRSSGLCRPRRLVDALCCVVEGDNSNQF